MFIRRIRPTVLFSIQLVLIILGILNFSQNIFSVEFLKDSSTKLMCIVLANPLNVDNKTFLRVKKCHNPIIDTVY